MRLINATAIINTIEKHKRLNPNLTVADCIKIINNAPTVEPEKEVVPVCKVTFDKKQLQEIVDKKVAEMIERPQGEWIDYNNTFYKCPDCGYLLEKCCPQCQNRVILPKGGAE